MLSKKSPKVMTAEQRAAKIAELRHRAWRDPSLTKEQKAEARFHANQLEKLQIARAGAGKK